MKTTETKKLTETQQTVLDFIEKFGGSADIISTGTQLNKLLVLRTVKALAEKNLITINAEIDPPIYTFANVEGNTYAHVKTPTKAVTNVEENKVSGKKSAKTAITKKVVEDEVALKTEGRDTSKLKFNGELYGKGRLVLAVVQKYMLDNPKTTFTKLKEVFPDELQPRYGMIQEVSKAKKISADRDRYFLKPEDLIKVGDKKVAVCNQFGSHNLPLKYFKTLGFVIK
ncbi:MAG: hypothetical protein A3F72_03685 [Bacteroidetes bacterium RIFCSPLOWO2_12_FULL_35_15]|nr:MAG: hypothetical protein A3F72_03685 [Bacteroidetes bacterium RIFCSPLOWO2_12_FULL_35_15]